MESDSGNLFVMDRKAVSVASLDEHSDEKAFWLKKTPSERLMVVEYLRQMAYGYDPATERLQRFFEIAEL